MYPPELYRLRELSLFTGGGGGLLAGGLLAWEPQCYVEYNDYCQRLIARRIADGVIPRQPIFGDIRTFTRDGYARSYKGMVDVCSGGFPCVPFSSAARGRNDLSKDRWTDMRDVIAIVQPKWVFCENVTRGALQTACEDLYALGYSTAYAKFCSSQVGCRAPRPRWWAVAYANGDGESRRPVHAEAPSVSTLERGDARPDPPRAMGGVARLAHRMDRLRALGNGQDPVVAATAFLTLGRELLRVSP